MILIDYQIAITLLSWYVKTQYCPTSWLRASVLLVVATIIWFKIDFSFFKSVIWSWKLRFSSFWFSIPLYNYLYSPSTKGFVVLAISSLVFSILFFMVVNSCLNNSISLWYYCRSRSASLTRFLINFYLYLNHS